MRWPNWKRGGPYRQVLLPPSSEHTTAINHRPVQAPPRDPRHAAARARREVHMAFLVARSSDELRLVQNSFLITSSTAVLLMSERTIWTGRWRQLATFPGQISRDLRDRRGVGRGLHRLSSTYSVTRGNGGGLQWFSGNVWSTTRRPPLRILSSKY